MASGSAIHQHSSCGPAPGSVASSDSWAYTVSHTRWHRNAALPLGICAYTLRNYWQLWIFKWNKFNTELAGRQLFHTDRYACERCLTSRFPAGANYCLRRSSAHVYFMVFINFNLYCKIMLYSITYIYYGVLTAKNILTKQNRLHNFNRWMSLLLKSPRCHWNAIRD